MEIGVGLDSTLALSYAEQAELSALAAKLGYTQIWTNETGGEDAFQTCAMRWAATRDVLPGGVTTGIAVSPVAMRTPMGFAISAATMSKMSGGRFILGVGSGQADVASYRHAWNLRGTSALGLMRDYVTTIRALLRGETVDYTGPSVELHGVKLNMEPPPPTPVYLAALGPKMTMLAGEIADGVSLNWCDPETIALSRKRVQEAAERAGRDPSEVKLAMYVRVCVDEDEAEARRVFTRSMQSYALGQLDAPLRSYRAHFERMGFTDDLRRIDDMRRRNAPQDEIIDAFPESMLRKVGYYGNAAGAAEGFKQVAQGLDIAIVRVVGVRPGMASARATVEACAGATG